MDQGSSLWPTAVARGDLSPINIRPFSDIQDGVIPYGGPGQPVCIGESITAGHGATLADGCLVGIDAIVLNGVTVGEGALIAAGSAITKDVSPRMMVREFLLRPAENFR
ncbi:hypothetical protein [Synechococcus sp. M16CYN]|uniref:gamma carbonic anhydrase family protein n=1 Tax=Synechococcus sp. M16CYN TaxID=3103139 RepID=UPI0032544D22